MGESLSPAQEMGGDTGCRGQGMLVAAVTSQGLGGHVVRGPL